MATLKGQWATTAGHSKPLLKTVKCGTGRPSPFCKPTIVKKPFTYWKSLSANIPAGWIYCTAWKRQSWHCFQRSSLENWTGASVHKHSNVDSKYLLKISEAPRSEEHTS